MFKTHLTGSIPDGGHATKLDHLTDPANGIMLQREVEMLPIVIVVAYIALFAVFLAVLIAAVLSGQRFQRRQIGELHKELEVLSRRLRSAKEREADEARRRATLEANQRVRDLYEHGGC